MATSWRDFVSTAMSDAAQCPVTSAGVSLAPERATLPPSASQHCLPFRTSFADQAAPNRGDCSNCSRKPLTLHSSVC